MTDYIITEIRWVNCKIGLNFWATELKYKILCVWFLKLLRQKVLNALELTNGSLTLKIMYSSFLESKAKKLVRKNELMQKG